MAKVYHAEIFGLREAKYNWLNKNDIKKVKWNKLEPRSEFYLFIPQNTKVLSSYQSYIKMKDVFPINGVGMTTARDEFVIDFNKDVLINRIRLFRISKLDDEELHKFFNIRKKKGWSIRKAYKLLKELSNDEFESLFLNVLYRPFDTRTIFYHDSLVWRTVKQVMRHMFNENVGIICPRQFKELPGAFISDTIIGHKTVSAYDINSLFPLYTYQNVDKKDLFSEHESGEKKPNIKPELFGELKFKYKKEVTPEDIFYYIYAVLYSNIYRTKYAEFLKIDFPRIPFTSNYKLFVKLGKLGKQLADLHLLKSDELNKPISKFSGRGDSKVTQRPKFEDEKVYINSTKYFSSVKAEFWNYQIGGYQVCDKWLKDRKDRELSLDEIQTYCKIVTALSKTIELQKEIDENYEGVEK